MCVMYLCGFVCNCVILVCVRRIGKIYKFFMNKMLKKYFCDDHQKYFYQKYFYMCCCVLFFYLRLAVFVCLFVCVYF